MNAICCGFARTAFLVALLSFVGPNLQAQTYVFGTASYSAPGLNSTSAILTADFNGDGIPDPDSTLTGQVPTSALLSTLIGNGDGTFQNEISQTVPASLGSLAVGDFMVRKTRCCRRHF